MTANRGLLSTIDLSRPSSSADAHGGILGCAALVPK